ncbi:MAG: peptidylprolyl isomerase, partial [Hungatella sp.]
MKCIISTRDFGDMVFDLFPDFAPITTGNFVETVNRGFYNGLTWCRIVQDYVIQSGSPDNDIMTDSAWHIQGEFAENGFDNPILHKRGALSMARDDGYDTAGTQFFVVHKDAHKLDGRYAAFGQMTEGYDVLDRIAALP